MAYYSQKQFLWSRSLDSIISFSCGLPDGSFRNRKLSQPYSRRNGLSVSTSAVRMNSPHSPLRVRMIKGLTANAFPEFFGFFHESYCFRYSRKGLLIMTEYNISYYLLVTFVHLAQTSIPSVSQAPRCAGSSAVRFSSRCPRLQDLRTTFAYPRITSRNRQFLPSR